MSCTESPTLLTQKEKDFSRNQPLSLCAVKALCIVLNLGNSGLSIVKPTIVFSELHIETGENKKSCLRVALS